MNDELEVQTPENDDEDAYEGVMLTESPEKVAKRLSRMWSSQEQMMSPLVAQWDANRLRRSGVSSVQVVKDTDTSRYKVYAPPMASRLPGLNKATVLARKFVGLLFSDPPIPQVMPASGDDADRDAAEAATRFLTDLQSEACGGIHPIVTATDRAMTYASGFVHEVVVEKGKRVARSILAKPSMTSPDVAMNPEAYPDEWAATATEPLVERFVKSETTETQVQTLDAEGLPVLTMEASETLVFVETAKEADREWAPILRSEILTGRNVRMFPPTAESIWEADAVLIANFQPLSVLKSRFPEAFADRDEEELEKAIDFQPADADCVLPPGTGKAVKQAAKKAGDKLVFTLTAYHKPCAAYPEGAFVVSAGDTVLLHREEWNLDIPVTQIRPYADGTEHSFGMAFIEIVAPADSLRDTFMGAAVTHLDRFVNRRLYLPSTSTLSPSAVRHGMGDVLSVNPGGMPITEEISGMPRDIPDMISLADSALADLSGLTDAALGESSASVQSARHASTLVAQANASLSGTRQALERAIVRWWRIRLQLVREFFPAEQKARWLGEDGAYRTKSFSVTDLASDADVTIRPGSFSMQNAQARANLVQEYGQGGLLQPDEVREFLASSVGGTLGLQDDPIRSRALRQLSRWTDGPQTQDPQNESLAIFQPISSDSMPLVAQARLYHFVRSQNTVAYEKSSPEWRAGLDAAIQFAQQALMPPPAPGQEPPPEQAPPQGPPPQAPMEEPMALGLGQSDNAISAPVEGAGLPITPEGSAQAMAGLEVDGLDPSLIS